MIIVNEASQIELANLQTEQMFGYSRKELLHQSVDVLLPAGLRAAHRDHRAHAEAPVNRREMGVGMNVVGLRKDGTEFPVEVSLSQLEGVGERTVIASVRDITGRREAAFERAREMSELSHSNEALEQFAHIASHDLQEPLRMVASYTQLLAKRYRGRLDADADVFIDFAVDGTQRMKQLIQDLLLYSRAGKGTAPTHEFASEEALREALKNLGAAIEETGAVVTYDRLPVVNCVSSELAQVFQNLIGNAIHYHSESVPHVHVSALSKNWEWEFSISDNGIGIDPRYFERIFLIFQRLHGSADYKGTGIGLAICKRILQQQGGRIWVESELGHGSIFHFALPMR